MENCNKKKKQSQNYYVHLTSWTLHSSHLCYSAANSSICSTKFCKLWWRKKSCLSTSSIVGLLLGSIFSIDCNKFRNCAEQGSGSNSESQALDKVELDSNTPKCMSPPRTDGMTGSKCKTRVNVSLNVAPSTGCSPKNSSNIMRPKLQMSHFDE